MDQFKQKVLNLALGDDSARDVEVANEILNDQPLVHAGEHGELQTTVADEDPSVADRHIEVSLKLLAASSGLLRDGLIDVDLHASIEKRSISAIKRRITTVGGRDGAGSNNLPSIEFKEVNFAGPLVFSSLSFEKLKFTDCTFDSAVHFSAIESSSCIEFSRCTFATGHELLLRFLNFPKPEDASEWRPSLFFEDCLIKNMWVFKSQVFLFFVDSVIESSTLELTSGSVTQYVNCQLIDAIIHDTANEADRNPLVPRGWFRNVGWMVN